MATSDENTKKKITIAAMADLHMQPSMVGFYRDILTEISDKAQVLVLAGDLTDHGYKSEAELLVQELIYCKIPVVGVLGNHDYSNGQQEEIKEVFRSSPLKLLEEEPFVMDNVGFAGVKGFGGGFGTHMLALFGEEAMKSFVYEAINESLQLENGLQKLETEKKIVVLHYSPIRETIVGEPEEIFPFLGSSRLMEPIDNYNVTAVFHGHAHYGSPTGSTLKGIPVYNASMNVMKKLHEQMPYALVEV